MVLIKNPNYLSPSAAVIDQDEYREMMTNIQTIVQKAVTYLDDYVGHVTGKQPMSPNTFNRMYSFSTLKYFHDILGI